MSETHRVTIGHISRVRGLKGEMVVIPLTDDPHRFEKLQRVTLSKEENSSEFRVERVWASAGKVLLKLREVGNPEEARRWVGGFVEIENDQLVKLPQGRYFVFDIVGLEVFTILGQRMGKVKEVISLPANDVYLVEGEGKQYDIPAIKRVVKKIDLDKKKMIIDPIEGLLDL